MKGKNVWKVLVLSFVTIIILSLLNGCGHEHIWIEATCTAPKTCSECGETEGEALGHNWIVATCTAPKTCSVCGITEGNATGHKWNNATCTEPKTCSVCGITEGEALGHDAKPTCEEDAICSMCGEVLKALGHTWTKATCTEPKTCSVCGKTDGKALGHTWAEATCTEPKTCSVCGETEGEALGHKWEEATCTEPRTCSVCGETEGKAPGHDWIEATCTEPKTCSVCGETEGEAAGHKWIEATCTEPKTCSVCGITEGEALGHTTTNGKCERCGEEIYAPQEFAGAGDNVITDINIGGSGIYRAHITHSGSRNFIVKSYDADGDHDLLINEIGSYDGYVLLTGESPIALNIEADGSWYVYIEQCGATSETAFSGHGDYVTDLFSASSGSWTFTYSGEHNFVVRVYTTKGRDLLVNTIGSYEGTQMVSIPAGSKAMFEITADTYGSWTITKN